RRGRTFARGGCRLQEPQALTQEGARGCGADASGGSIPRRSDWPGTTGADGHRQDPQSPQPEQDIMIQQGPPLACRVLATGLLMLCAMAAAQEPAPQPAPAEGGLLDALLSESSPPASDASQAPAGNPQEPEREHATAEELDVIPVATRPAPTQTLT